MTPSPRTSSYVLPSEDELPLLRQAKDALAGDTGNDAKLVFSDGTSVKIPDSLLQSIVKATEYLSEDLAVSILSVHRGLTTQQAADLLDVSRPFLIQLLDQGEIPYYMVGTHRRIQIDDLFRFKHRRDEERRGHLRDLTRYSREIGLYDLPEDQP